MYHSSTGPHSRPLPSSSFQSLPGPPPQHPLGTNICNLSNKQLVSGCMNIQVRVFTRTPFWVNSLPFPWAVVTPAPTLCSLHPQRPQPRRRGPLQEHCHVHQHHLHKLVSFPMGLCKKKKMKMLSDPKRKPLPLFSCFRKAGMCLF